MATIASAMASEVSIVDRFAITVVLDGDPRDPGLQARVEDVQRCLSGVDAQLLVACEEPWDQAPEGVEVVVFASAGKGDRHDAAARRAGGALIAFADSRVTFTESWATEALRLFEDPAVVVAGGPVVPRGVHRRERVSALVMTHFLGGSPAAHNLRPKPARSVREVGASNVVIRTAAFRAVGGFQAPPGGGGEAVRLCYKVRTLLGGKIISAPGLTLSSPASIFPGALFRDIATYGRSRGALARRLPEAAPLFPYALPSVATMLVVVLACLLAVVGGGLLGGVLLALIVAVVSFFLIQSVRTLRGSEALPDRLVAGLSLPFILVTYGLTFVRGYFGSSMEDVAPPRERVAPLRVLIVNWRDVTHPWSGGAETYMHQIAKRWADEGIDVGWLTARSSGSARREVIDRIHFYRVGGRATLYVRAAITYLTRLRTRYDVIIDCENGIPFYTPAYSRLPKVLLVHHVHQEIFRSQVPRQLRWLALWLEGSLMPWMYRNTTVVAVSEGTRSDLADLGFDPARIQIITNGVIPPKPASAARAAHPSLMCMGRLKPQKSVDVLIRAMPRIIEQIPDLHVDIVGQGPDRTRLERLAWSLGMASHIHFHGYVRSVVRDEIASRSWAAVCPSAFEGWGVVCMEASARGLPVVASNVAGLRESVLDGETGVLVPYGDETALADALISLLGDERRMAQMGEAGVRWAAAHTWDGSARQFAGLIRRETGRHLGQSGAMINLGAGHDLDGAAEAGRAELAGRQPLASWK
jgi:glycosyltransferase involved in cell wall biosynthesis